MDSSSCLKNQDVSDLLAQDLVKRLIKKDEDENTERQVKKIRYFFQETLKCDNKIIDPDQIPLPNKGQSCSLSAPLTENLSSLNDLLNHALDKTLGLNESTNTSINLIEPTNQAFGSNNCQEFNDFKVPELPFKPPKNKSSRKLSKSSKNKSTRSKQLTSESIIENDLFESIVKEVISQDCDVETSEIEDESELKHKKKRKKKDKHTHHCSKHRKRKVEEDDKQESPVKELHDNYPFGDRGEEHKKTDFEKNYQDDKYYSPKKCYTKVSLSSRSYSEDDYDERSRKYDSLNKYKSRYKYRELDSRPYDEQNYEYSKSHRYEKYDKNYEKTFDRYDGKYDKYHDERYYDEKYDEKHDSKNQFYMKKLKAENTVSNWTKLCSKISKEQDDDNSSIESRDFYSDDDDTRSMMSERILSRDSFKAKEIKFDVRDFKTRQARTASEIKHELLDLFPVSSGVNHQWKEVDKAAEKKTDEKSKKASKTTNQKEQELENKVDDFLNKHVQVNKSGFDIGTIMSQRLSALKILANDATNITALNQLKEADDLINEWSLAKSANAEQEDPNRDSSILTMTIDNQTYESYSNFTLAAKSKDGIGMALLCKMGWQPGQGLGKNNEGVVEPLIPELKLDTKGLIAEEERAHNRRNNVQGMYNIPQPAPKMSSVNVNCNSNTESNRIVSNCNQASCEQLTAIANRSIISGKHPVNILQEVCSRRKWKAPTYTIVNEDGPAHKKNFLIKCTLNHVDYLPSFSSPNKKLAKAISAIVCLQAFGLVNLDEM